MVIKSILLSVGPIKQAIISSTYRYQKIIFIKIKCSNYSDWVMTLTSEINVPLKNCPFE